MALKRHTFGTAALAMRIVSQRKSLWRVSNRCFGDFVKCGVPITIVISIITS
jgi:hypothetical protein